MSIQHQVGATSQHLSEGHRRLALSASLSETLERCHQVLGARHAVTRIHGQLEQCHRHDTAVDVAILKLIDVLAIGASIPSSMPSRVLGQHAVVLSHLHLSVCGHQVKPTAARACGTEPPPARSQRPETSALARRAGETARVHFNLGWQIFSTFATILSYHVAAK